MSTSAGASGDVKRPKLLFVCFQNSIHAAKWIRQASGGEFDVHVFHAHLAPLHENFRDITVHIPHVVHMRWEAWLYRVVEKGESLFGGLGRHRLACAFSRIKAGLDGLIGPTSALRLYALPPERLAADRIKVEYTTPPMPALFAAALLQYFAGKQDVDSPWGPLYGPRSLRGVIARIRPDIVHSMEFQLNGYLTLEAKRISGANFPKWIATNYGSDLYYFRQFPEHERTLRRLLSSIDYYDCECRRDLVLAREMGLKAPALAIIPNSGGMDLDVIGSVKRQDPPSSRRVIAVKGYENWSGRAITALQALEKCADVLSGYEIVVYCPDAACAKYIQGLADSRLRITIQPRGSHESVLALLARSRIYLGVSLSDGISTAMLEAMSLGAFPIQTATSSASDWIESGRTGFIVDVNANQVAGRVRVAVANDVLVDQAAELNWRTCRERLDYASIRDVVVRQYMEIADGTFKEAVPAAPKPAPRPTPKVSIVIPVYNGANYLRDAVDSALAQTYAACEIIVVNDGSKDEGKTREIALGYGDKIRYFEKPNGGVATALNFGIDRMRGDYFSWLSHDDAYAPDKVARQMELLSGLADAENVAVYSDYEVMDETGRTIYACRWDHDRLERKPLYGVLRGYIHGCSLLIPRAAFARFGKFDEKLRVTQDYALWFKMIREMTFKHLPRVLVRSRWHVEQDTKIRRNDYVQPECNKLWISFQDELTEPEILSCEATKGLFFLELARFLETTPYDEARQHARDKAVEHADDLLVTAIIPVYNRMKWAEEAVRSVLRQTHRRLEVIVVNDGSTEDDSALRELCGRDPRVVFLSQANWGASAARNAALDVSKGEFVAFLDGDDVWVPNKVEKQLKAMLAGHWQFSHTSYLRMWDRGRFELMHSGRLSADAVDVVPEIICNCGIATSTVMADRRVFEKRRFPRGVWPSEDALTWIDIAADTPILGMPLPLARIRVSPNTSALDSKTQLAGLENIHNFVVGDARFRRYLVPTARRYLLSGWCEPEANGVWTSGTRSVLSIPVPNGSGETMTVAMDLIPLVAAGLLDGQRVVVSAGDRQAAAFSAPREGVYTVRIPGDAVKDGKLEFVLEIPTAASPKKLGQFDSDGIIGIYLKSVEIAGSDGRPVPGSRIEFTSQNEAVARLERDIRETKNRVLQSQAL